MERIRLAIGETRGKLPDKSTPRRLVAHPLFDDFEMTITLPGELERLPDLPIERDPVACTPLSVPGWATSPALPPAVQTPAPTLSKPPYKAPIVAATVTTTDATSTATKLPRSRLDNIAAKVGVLRAGDSHQQTKLISKLIGLAGGLLLDAEHVLTECHRTGTSTTPLSDLLDKLRGLWRHSEARRVEGKWRPKREAADPAVLITEAHRQRIGELVARVGRRTGRRGHHPERWEACISAIIQHCLLKPDDAGLYALAWAQFLKRHLGNNETATAFKAWLEELGCEKVKPHSFGGGQRGRAQLWDVNALVRRIIPEWEPRRPSWRAHEVLVRPLRRRSGR